MKNIILTLFTLLSVPYATRAQPPGYNTGMPFGRIGPAELDHLEVNAKKADVDPMGDVKRAYEKALARVFAFSLKFTQLDRGAKTYGQIIYSSFLNLAETHGIERNSELVASQPEAVRQRIRDFIYYHAPSRRKNIARKQKEPPERMRHCFSRAAMSSEPTMRF
jgi:hypothetical protein